MAERPDFASWGASYDAIVVPYEQAILDIRAGDLSSVDMVIEFLEVRPKFFRSGYLAEKILRRLGGTPLTARQHERALAAAQAIAGERSREAGQARKTLARLTSR